MRRGRQPTATPSRTDVDAALAALGADELREVVRSMLLELDDRAHARVATSLVHRAARGGSGWAPAALSDAEVAEAVAFADAARRVGRADPSDVDERLRRGSAAFLRKDYATARQILGVLLRPIAEAEIDLGQHEMVDEVLGVDASECAVQYVVAVYMTTDPARRAEEVRSAIGEVRGAGYFFEPIRDMDRVAVEPLPDLEGFLTRWRAIVAEEAAGERRSHSDTQVDGWLREVVQRMEGSGGLAKVARATKRAGDLRAWCRSLVDAGDWRGARSAFDEAAELVSDESYVRGDFLDGAALAAQELGERDLSPWLERAWRAEPSLTRLRRWLGASRDRATVRERAGDALAACSEQAHRQRAVLHVLQREFEAAAKLLAAAPGLGWSGSEHPGQTLFGVFQTLLGKKAACSSDGTPADLDTDLDDLGILRADDGKPHLATPELDDILRQAGVERIADTQVRKAVLAAMRKAAESRVARVTEEKRRRQYSHAAALVAACVACDRSPESIRWAATMREDYRRFPALRAELDRELASS